MRRRPWISRVGDKSSDRGKKEFGSLTLRDFPTLRIDGVALVTRQATTDTQNRHASSAISESLLKLETLSAQIRENAHAFRANLDRVAESDAIAEMRRLLASIR